MVSFLVVPTLTEPDVILGMDLLQRLGVKIDAKAEVAKPTMLVSHVQPFETWRIPARKSMVFPIRNPFPEKKKKIFYLNQVIALNSKGDHLIGKGRKNLRKDREC